ncbi:pyruvate kinase [cf. Phormidesmis sp. LEGE 11477]|uniref:pyruvate kinase n=1 Tax=cf. Phormidesmis sp. LEGE 11477 TaxID=1828680 RepID=UPI00187F7034|nr:pyruvate kinase [cf. Phormidesmis sp. LEGE 11477]MBE9059845.1 pyruvate kinase [cf. Phormidesmis sp. LEGE 11477]
MNGLRLLHPRTKIVATIGPASRSPDVIRQMMQAGMNVARLNFSHGSYEDHAQQIRQLRAVSHELQRPLTLLQDLQGPKIRVGQLPGEGLPLAAGDWLRLVPIGEAPGEAPGEVSQQANQSSKTVEIDYPHLATDAEIGTPVLLDDGLLELRIEAVEGTAVRAQVVTGGLLKSRKGVNLPTLNLQMPSITEKDKQDLVFGAQQGVDVVSLSFVRQAEDVQVLKKLLAQHSPHQSVNVSVLAKLEKPQAIENLEAIVNECDAIMVARGDLGVEMRPEKVPLIQKRIIRLCNQKGIPVITATQMLESMTHSPRPTRAEASDVANAIIDGTDAVMLSGESAVGQYPVEAVGMLSRIASDVEPEIEYTNFPPSTIDDPHAISEALNAIDRVLDLRCIVTFTETGHTARLAAAERPRAPIVALTANPKVYHQLNLVWGIRPVLLEQLDGSLEVLFQQMEDCLLERQFAQPEDKVLLLGGLPIKVAGSTNFLKIHTIGHHPID